MSALLKELLPYWEMDQQGQLLDSFGRPFLSQKVEKYILGRPVELKENETFTVTINMPLPPTVELVSTKFRILMPEFRMSNPEPANLEPHKCHCSVRTLMMSGCGCGGI